MLDQLLDELCVLAERFDKEGLSLILAGGMGLYLRDLVYDPKGRSPDYPMRPTSRSTEDLDIFLNTRIIVDSEATRAIRHILDDLGYVPVTEHFQFERSLDYDAQQSLKVDLLAIPPDDKQRDAVTTGEFRIRPNGHKYLHGLLTEEAAGLEVGKLPMSLSEVPGRADDEPTVFIPSSLNYLVLKLHAFDDRKKDADSDYGRHHAFDIFRIVTDMRRDDWEQAHEHLQEAPDAEYLEEARRIYREFFDQRTSLGVIRLEENKSYKEHRDEYDTYIGDFMEDLEELFGPS